MMAADADGIAVLGAGSWGTALAILLARNRQATILWGRDPAQIARMRAQRCNTRYLPDCPFPDRLAVTVNLAAAVGAARDVLLVVPSRAFREVLDQLRPLVRPDARICWATKGFEPGSAHLLHEVTAEVLGPARACAVLSGPTFAREVARGLPTAVTIASHSADFAAALRRRFHGRRFRVYTSSDMVGVEAGGAVKNVLAVAAGIADGLGFGANTRAALITRGLAELTRFGVALGAQRSTLMGLAGLGDLVLTCTDDQSRNRRLGLALAHGKSLAAAQAELGQVAEGAATAPVVLRLARRHAVEMPITEQVERVLHAGVAPTDAVNALLSRAPGTEYG